MSGHKAGLPRPGQPKISCVVPCLNEGKNLQTLLPLLEGVIRPLSTAWEIIVVDDGSTDGTPGFMQSLATTPGYCYLQLSRNFGKEAALSAGLQAAQGEVVICLDADLQHPPELIPDMLAAWNQGADVVFAVRKHRRDESGIKRFGTALLYQILNNGGKVKIPPDAGDFRLMDRQVVLALLSLPERTRFMKGLYAWVGFNAKAIEYQPSERLYGETRFNLLNLVNFALDGITAFSTWPLKVLNLVGATTAFLAFTYGLFLVFDYQVEGNKVSGWTTIVTSMLFLSGINLLGMGIIGTYVGRLFNEVKQRPLYIVRHSINNDMHVNNQEME